MSISAKYQSLQGRAVFITGGATGIGRTMVDAFVAQGARVAFVDINGEAGDELAGHHGDSAWFRRTDVIDTVALETAIRDASEAIGPIMVLINNVADDTRHAVLDTSPEEWRRILAVNLDAAYVASRAVVPLMQSAGSGSIINVSSVNAVLGLPNMPGYVTAKAGLLGMTKAFAAEFGVDRIRVNAILPGWVVTERQLEQWLTPEAEEAWSEQVSLKDRLLPEDVAALALFLAADDSAMITGQSLTVDAGRT